MYRKGVMHCNENAQCNVNIAMYGNVNKNIITKKKKFNKFPLHNNCGVNNFKPVQRNAPYSIKSFKVLTC